MVLGMDDRSTELTLGVDRVLTYKSIDVLAARSAAGLTFTEAHGAKYDDDDEDYSPEEDDDDSANGDDPSEELVYWV